MALVFSILGGAISLPSRNSSLFLSLYALFAVLLGGLLAFHGFVVAPTLIAIVYSLKDSYAVSTDLLLKLALDGGRFVFGLLAFQAILAIIGLQSTVATLAGDATVSLLDLLKKIRDNKGPFLTVLVAYALLLLHAAVLAGLAVLGFYLHSLGGAGFTALAVFVWVVLAVLFLFFLYNVVLSLTALAASVANASVSGFAAVKLAWALLAPVKLSAFLFGVFLLLLDVVTRPLYVGGMFAGYSAHNTALAVALAVIYLLIAVALEIFVLCAVTLLYDKRRSESEDVLLLYTAIPADAPSP